MNLPVTPVSAKLLFKGRAGDPRLGEWVVATPTPPAPSSALCRVVIVGSPDDQGVLRNRGRAGAKAGPDSIRKHLYKMTPPADFEWEKRLALFDLGNVIVSDDIRQTHAHTREAAQAVAATGATVLSLGGGNDFTAPGFLGFVEGCRQKKAQGSFAIVNVDPHLDVRELEGGLPHSGTPYRQIVESGLVRGKDVVEFGARENRNARVHWKYCEDQGIAILGLRKMRSGSRSVATVFRQTIARLAAGCARIGVSFDLDCCADGEGTSAAPVIGFSAWELCELAAAAGAQVKVDYFELVEVAPLLDPHERTSRIAAEMAYSFLLARARSLR